jgi:hypothetical protein
MLPKANLLNMTWKEATEEWKRPLLRGVLGSIPGQREPDRPAGIWCAHLFAVARPQKPLAQATHPSG